MKDKFSKLNDEEFAHTGAAWHEALYNAVDFINNLGKAKLSVVKMENIDDIIFLFTVSDDDLRDKVIPNLDLYDNNLKLFQCETSLGKSFFWSKITEPFDTAIGITRDMSLYKKAILRCAYTILEQYANWKKKVIAEHPELK